jgi:hypothetical protein
MKPFHKFVHWLAAASFCGGAVLLVINFGARFGAQPRHMVSAVLLAVLIVGAVGLAAKAMAATNSNVIEHAPEMSSLAFPPSSSYRK